MPISALTTSDLLFTCADLRALPEIRASGIPEGAAFYTDLTEARQRCTGCILVVEARWDRQSIRGGGIRNVDPYLDPVPVPAAGGFVVRGAGDEKEILLILRRGIWDLPKGKLDAGETIEECAVREVREELGIESVEIAGSLGHTVHGYPHDGRYAVKTTHWFAMRTDADSFRPQKKERIERVEWVRLSEAVERLGFETLRRHLEAVRGLL